jgi:hypothetical protein
MLSAFVQNRRDRLSTALAVVAEAQSDSSAKNLTDEA